MEKESTSTCRLILREKSPPILDGQFGAKSHIFFLARLEKNYWGLIVPQKNQSLLGGGAAWEILEMQIIQGPPENLRLIKVRSGGKIKDDWSLSSEDDYNIFLFRFREYYGVSGSLGSGYLSEILLPYPK